MTPPLLDGFSVDTRSWDEKKKGGGAAVASIPTCDLDTIDCGFRGTQRPRQEDRSLGICSSQMD